MRLPKRILVTGSSGFLGRKVARELLKRDYMVLGVDLIPFESDHPNLVSLTGDIRIGSFMAEVFSRGPFAGICHCAAVVVSQAVRDKGSVDGTNVGGTRLLVELAVQAGVPKLVFISTCCLWKRYPGHPVTEDEPPCPGEPYGVSKLEAERIVLSAARTCPGFDAVVIRSPTIVGEERLGYLSLLFQFVAEGRKVWVIGRGDNRIQFVSVDDVVDAVMRSLEFPGTDVFNVGADEVKPLREVYQALIAAAGSSSKVAGLPRIPALAAMRLGYWLRISPLGPYHYRGIADEFLFDTRKSRSVLGWSPTARNEDLLIGAYRHYRRERQDGQATVLLSEHQRPVWPGVIDLLRRFS